MLAQRDGAALHQTQYPCFRRRVVSLLSSTHESGDRGDAHDGTARGRLRDHLTGGCLDGVEGTIQVRADGFGQQIRFYAKTAKFSRRVDSRLVMDLLQKLSERADARIADEYVQPSPLIDHLFHQYLARFWI